MKQQGPNLTFLILLTMFSCISDRSKEVDQSMRRYDSLLLRMDADGIAGLYTAEGKMSGEKQKEIIGRDSIRTFLRSFRNLEGGPGHIQVLAYKSNSDTTELRGDSALQTGSYYQKVRVDKDTLELGGRYRANWVLESDQQWRIKKMYTYHYKNLR